MTVSIRECFVSRYGPDDGFLVEFDFSQLEICALAEVSGDELLISELNSGADIHRLNAAMWLGKTPDEVTTEERKKAKVMTFQLQYGAGSQKMAESLGILFDAAQNFIHNFYTKYRGVKKYHDVLSTERYDRTVSSKKQTDQASEVWVINPTPTGRMYTLSFRQKDAGDFFYSSTEMKNYPIQGFGTADIVPIVLNMIYDECYVKLGDLPYTPLLINTVHDSIMFDCHYSCLYKLFAVVETCFQEFPKTFEKLFDYKLKVLYNYDVKFGKNWLEKDMVKLSRSDVQNLIDT